MVATHSFLFRTSPRHFHNSLLGDGASFATCRLPCKHFKRPVLSFHFVHDLGAPSEAADSADSGYKHCDSSYSTGALMLMDHR